MKLRKFLALSLVLGMLLAYIPAPVSAATTVASGTCGDNLTWVLDSDGVLTISGTGDMENYDEGEAPWYSYRKKIASAVIKSGVTSIGDIAFYNCSSLTSVTIPASVISIGEDAFCSCTVLTSVTIPASVTSIGNYAFRYCASLEGIWVDEDNAYYSSGSCGVLFNKDKTQLIQAPGIISGSYTIPASVTSIGNYAFSDCSGLTSVTIPASVTSIGNYAFLQCSGLTSVTIPASVTSIGNYAFQDCSSLTSVAIPDSVTSIDDYVFYYCSSLTSVVIPDSVTSIGTGAFSKCSSLTSVTIPDGVTSIGSSAFYYCSSLTSVTIPDGVTSIGIGVFEHCTSLTSVTIPDSVTSIGTWAFGYCSSLTSVTIPDSVTSIDTWAFEHCSNLTDIYFLGNVPTFGFNVLYGVTATAWYPSGDSTWTDDVMQDHGGDITWKSYDPSAFMVLNQPTSQKVPVNAEATFSVYATGTGLSYQWQYRTSSSGSWLNCTSTGNMTATMSVAATCAMSGYQYRCKITDSAGNTVTTDAVYLYVLGVTTHPASVEAEAGDTVKFTVAATGDGVTYLWQYLNDNGVWATTTLSGYKTATLTVGATAARDGKQYRCKLTDSAGNVVYSNAATLSVKAAETLAITTQPTTQKVKAGTTASFSVVASGDGLTYQWQYRTSSGGSWLNCTADGNKTATMSVAATTGKSSYQYRCKITDSAGNTVTTNTVYLYVLGVKTQPTTQKVKAGTTATFTVSATGLNKTYQWQYRTSASGTWINCTASGNKTATMKVAATCAKSSYQYRCKITDSAGNVVYTNTVYLYVLGIKTQPTSQTVSAGSTATFTVTATGHSKTYQWQYRTSSTGTWKTATATGNKTATLTVPGTASRNGYQYRCKITDSAGNVVYTNAVTLTVK